MPLNRASEKSIVDGLTQGGGPGARRLELTGVSLDFVEQC